MKNTNHTLWSLTITFVLAISLVNCGDGKPKPREEIQKSNLQAKAPVVDAPENIISLDQADAIYNNYSKHRIAAIESYENKQRPTAEAFEAARFVDYDYQMIKDYIAYVDQEAAKAGVKKITKLRMYFANYPDKKKFLDGKEVIHPKQNSIFMTPTLELNGINYSFYIGDDEKPKLIKDWKAEIEKGMGNIYNDQKKSQASLAPNFFNSSAFSVRSLILNHGHGPPPPRSEF